MLKFLAMNRTFSDETLAEYYSKLERQDSSSVLHLSSLRSPVHVVYGGANLFKAETPAKLGAIALKSLESYAPNFVEFARAFWLPGAEKLPLYDELIAESEIRLSGQAKKVKTENYAAWFAWTIYQRTIEKLQREAIEDFRIDFEDGYGFRRDEEEDSHAISASSELAKSFNEKTITAFCGFRIKSFQPETYRRAIRTLDLFLTNLLEKTGGALPENFVVTLPKIKRAEEVGILVKLLDEFENRKNLANGAIKVEILIETPESIFAMQDFVKAGNHRVNSAHFGAYDFTSSFGIVAEHQHLQHDSCKFARQMMQINLSPFGLRLSDSVTTEMPIPVFKGENLSESERQENRRSVHKAWRAHFNNVTNSLINGFYQSWDLHPAQLVGRYAAFYAFFLSSKDSSAARLKGFLDKASQALLTGNQFDDAASAQGLLNYFLRALNSGALTETEIAETTGLTLEELRTASFARIMANRL